MIETYKQHKFIIALGCIVLLGIFFRVYGFTSRLEFAHDGDLSAFIIKDIIVDHHPRLIGQLTSAQGIFIGPLFYYALAPFHFLTGMDPIGGVVFVTVLAVATIISFYFVISQLWNKIAGLIGAFCQAILLFHIIPDRSIVPTVFTPLWSIWYLYALVMVARGNMKWFPLLGLLAGLIWHFHIALAPAFLAVFIALIIAKKLPTVKQFGLAIMLALLPSMPLIVFEVKHNFIQTQSFITNFSQDHGTSKGIEKFYDVFLMISKNAVNLFFYPHSLPDWVNPVFLIVLLGGGISVLLKVKVMSHKDAIVLSTWIVGLVLFFGASSSPISEYYFASLEVIFIVIVSLICAFLWGYKRWTMWIVIAILLLLLAKNASAFFARGDSRSGYVARKSAAQFIADDAKQKGYSCVSVSYQTIQGENVGFRYFYWLNNLYLVDKDIGAPTYIIAIPESLAGTPLDFQSGIIGVVAPENPDTSNLTTICQSPNINLTEPIWGLVK